MEGRDRISYSPNFNNSFKDKTDRWNYYSEKKEQIPSKSTLELDTTVQNSWKLSRPKWCLLNTSIIEESQWFINKFCPFCGREIPSQTECFYWKNINCEVIFLCHLDCKDEFIQFTQYKNKARPSKGPIEKPQNPVFVGSRECFLTITISHALTSIKYYTSNLKVKIHGQKLFFKFDQQNSFQLFSPKMIIVPVSHFKVTLQLKKIGWETQNKTIQFSFSVNIPRQSTFITMESIGEEIKFKGEFQKITKIEEKHQAIQNLNFKYPFSITNEDLIQLNQFYIEFKDQGQFQQDLEENKEQESTPIYEELEEEKDKAKPQQNEQDHLDFIKTIKTRTGSKEFQKKVAGMNSQDIQKVINIILPFLDQIILNQYGNYMFQSLIGVCSFEQRETILLTLQDKIPFLVCQQQGTFVFQQLVSFLKRYQQFIILYEQAQKEFYKLCIDNFGNHFIRKLIQHSPNYMLILFLEKTVKYFVEFSTNKNGVCVLKHIIQRLRLGCDEKSLDFQRKIIDCLTLNAEKIIKNEFGNYLVQESYEVLGSKQLAGVNETIVRLFSTFACEKYSSNVLQNCIRIYWRKEFKIYDHLKSMISSKKILSLYRNKEGNKVLLEIMEMCPHTGLKEKINSVVSCDKSSKFNNNKWVKLRANRWTDEIGTSYKNFTEAQNAKKEEKYNNNM